MKFRDQKYLPRKGMACLAIAALTLLAATRAGATPVRIAIVPVGKDLKVELASSKLLERITVWPDCETVDRTSVANILRERALSAGSSEHYSDQLRAALPADVFVFIESGLISPNALRLRVSETRSGAVLCDVVATVDATAPTLPPLELAMTNALQKRVKLATTARYLAWLGAGTEETEGRLTYEAAALSVLVSPELLASPRVALLDRAHLGELGDETHVGALDLSLRTSVVVAEASIRRAGIYGDADVTMQMRGVSGNVITSMVLRISLTNLPGAARSIASAIQAVMFGVSQVASGSPVAAGGEAALLAARANALATAKEWPRALQLAESAYAIERSQRNRVQLAMTLASAGPDDPTVLGRSAEILGEYYHVVAKERILLPHGMSFHGRDPMTVTNTADKGAWQLLLDQEEDLFRARLQAGESMYYTGSSSDETLISSHSMDFYWDTWLDRLNSFGGYRPRQPAAQASLLTEVADQFVARLSTNRWICHGAIETVIATVNQPVIRVVTSTSGGASDYVGYLRHLHSSHDPLLRVAYCYGVIVMQRLGFQSSLGDLVKPETELGVEIANIMAAEMPATSPYRSTRDGSRAVFGLLLGRGIPGTSSEYLGLFEIERLFATQPPQNAVAPDVLKAQWRVYARTFISNSAPDKVATYKDGIQQLIGSSGQNPWPDYITELIHIGYLKEAVSLALALRFGPADLERAKHTGGASRYFWSKFLMLLMDSAYVSEAQTLANSLRPGADSLEFITGIPKISPNKPITLASPSQTTNPPPDATPWDDYVLAPLGCSFKRPFYKSGYYPDLERSAHQLIHLVPDGNILDVADVRVVLEGNGHYYGVKVVRINLTDGKVISDLAVKINTDLGTPEPALAWFVRAAASDAGHMYLATKKGVCVIDYTTGATSWIDAKSGLPGQDVRAMAILGTRLYLATGGGNAGEPFAFIVYDVAKASVEVLASERALQSRSAWDGEHITIKTMMADPKRGLLWLCDDKGVWRYEPAGHTFTLMAKSETYLLQHGRLVQSYKFPVLPSYCGEGVRVEWNVLYDIESNELVLPTTNMYKIVGYCVDDKILMEIPADAWSAVKYRGDLFSLSESMVLSRGAKTYLYKGDELNQPVGRLAGMTVTDAGLVLVNTRGKLFLLRQRNEGETPVERWSVESPLDPFIGWCASEVLAGRTLSESQRNTCQKHYEACLMYYDREKAGNFWGLTQDEAASFYANTLCMAVIDPSQYKGWSTRYRSVPAACAPLKEVLRYLNDPVLHAAVIIPAARCDETEYAATEYQRLSGMSPIWSSYIKKLAGESGDYHDRKFLDAINTKAKLQNNSLADAHLANCAAEVLTGHELSSQQQEVCQKRFDERLETLRKSLRPGDDEFRGADASIFYLNAFCMAIINPKRHGGWPVKYGGRAEAFAPLRDALRSSDEPIIRAAAVLAAVQAQDLEYAKVEYYNLKRQAPIWAKYIIYVEANAHGYRDGLDSFFYDAVCPL